MFLIATVNAIIRKTHAAAIVIQCDCHTVLPFWNRQVKPVAKKLMWRAKSNRFGRMYY